MRSVSKSYPEKTVIAHTVEVLGRILPSPRPVTLRLWDGTELSGTENSTATLVLCHPGALRRMFTPPIELSLGEAYIYSDFDIEGDLPDTVALIHNWVRDINLSPGEVSGLLRGIRRLPFEGGERSGNRRGPAQMSGMVHSPGRDRRAIQYHYDVGNDFYARWLDPAMQYSCAYFPTGSETLEEAQRHKMEYICRKLRLQPGERLLDIGCGWGGLARYAAQHYGVRVLGVTLSEQQAAYAQEQSRLQGVEDRVQVELLDYRMLGDASFDKIVSVGMFEHVGRALLPEYFSKVYRLLAPGGLFLNHGISRATAEEDVPNWPGVKSAGFGSLRSGLHQYLDERVVGAGSFSQRYVFPDGALVPVSAANLIAELAGLEVRDVENLREHYVQTLRHWVRRLGEHDKELTDLAGADVYRTWRLFFAVSASAFAAGRVGLNQSILAKPDRDGKVQIPLTRADLYR